MKIKSILMSVAVLFAAVTLPSCSGEKSLIVPRSVSTINSIPTAALNLKKGDYEILNTVTESASVTAKYTGEILKIDSGDGDFSYIFDLDKKKGWKLRSYSGTANFGYLMTDMTNSVDMPQAEEFARRVAVARLIDQVKDYGGDGVLEPLVTARANNVSKNVVEYTATVSAKIIKIHPTSK